MTAEERNSNPIVRYARWVIANKWKVAIASLIERSLS